MIRQFDVCPHFDREKATRTPFLVILQSHHVEGIETQIVAPLRAAEDIEKLSKVSVIVELNEAAYVLVVSELGYIPEVLLRRPVANLLPHEDGIRRALDRLFTGF